jgi:hypothetical protein
MLTDFLKWEDTTLVPVGRGLNLSSPTGTNDERQTTPSPE